ncbi:MAG: SusC/RagA family TonB-linked outer membrane protein, partial [Pedobacter sp.]
KISMTKSNAALEDIIKDLRRQSGYDFVVPGELLDKAKSVNIRVKDVDFEKVLDQIFESQPIAYEINNNTVTLKEKPKSYLGGLLDRLMAIDVSGKVIDSLSGSPLAGATISVKGGRQAVRTGADGSFFMQNVDETAILEISYTGYTTKEIPSSKNVGVISLSVAVGDLEEVAVTVNTGYQKIKPEQSTGAVSQMNTKQFESRISTNFLDGLTNRLPGLMINNNVMFNSTVPGGSAQSRPLFNIRGISTMSANQSPLIVIDGYPTELTLDLIDPNEIESVTILKDAAAAAVYGVRASNGVIVIQRKQAKKGSPQFVFRATAALTPKEDYSRYRWADDASTIVSNYQRTTQSGLINANSWSLLSSTAPIGGGTVTRSPVYYILAQQAAGMISAEQAAASFADMASYDNLNDYSRLFLRTEATQTYNFNVSGGNENALYYITGNYTGNRDTRINNDNNRLLLSARTTLKLHRKLSLELTTDYQEARANSAPVPGVTSTNPYERFQDVNGNPAYILGSSSVSPSYNNIMMSQGLDDHMYYPLVDVNAVNDKSRDATNRVKAEFTYRIGRGLDLIFGGIYENTRSEDRHYASDESSEARRFVNSYVVRNTDGSYKYNVPKGGFLRESAGNASSYTARTQLNYNKVLASDHSFNGIIGAEIRNFINKGNTASYFGYNDETLLQQPVDFMSMNTSAIRGSFLVGSPFANTFTNYFNQQFLEDRFLSGYGSMVYSYKGKYTATGTIRIDQSNLFGTNPKYKYKPLWSVGAGWNIDREQFMQDVDWVNQVKLRVAYGFNGNVAKLSLPEVIAQSKLNNFTSPASQSLNLLAYANSSLRWEQTENFNAGLDYTIFKNIRGSVDVYEKRSTDLMGNAQIDPTIGVSPTLINQATIRNGGIEFGLNADWIATSRFNWNSGIVVARNTSKVLDVFQKTDFSPQTLEQLGFIKNAPVGAMYSYRYAGIDNEGFSLIQDVEGNLYRTNVNTTGNPTATLMAKENSGVAYYTGSSLPTVNAGFSNRVDFGNFYVFAMLNYYGGFKLRAPRPDPSAKRPLTGAGDFWKATGDESQTEVMGLPGYVSANSRNAYFFADNYVVHGDYITLGDLTLSYNFNKSNFIKRAGLKNIELKAQASNLWTVGLNRYNYSRATGSFEKSYLTPTYSFALFTNF